jgi:branched-chain amino acid transport system substrate-binding protein
MASRKGENMPGRTSFARLIACAFSAAMIATPSTAQTPLKVGFLSTFSGPQGVLGEEIHNGFDVALSQLGGKLGGAPVEVIIGDDQVKPDVARGVVDKMIDQDKVDVLTGMLNSAVLLAMAQPAFKAGKIVISTIAAPSNLAGKQCDANFFVASPQNDGSSEAMGQYLQAKGVKRVFLISSNYPAGRDKMTGFKRYFKGEIVGEIYPAFTQMDYAAEIAQARDAKADAIFEFLPGGVGINFLKQFKSSGLDKSVKLYTDFGGIDETMIAAVGDDALGISTASFWTAGMDNPVSKKFLAGYIEKFKRSPSFYAAAGYDTALLLDTAIKSLGGKTNDKAALRKALADARFDAVRGAFRFGSNQIPLSDFYLTTATKDASGKIGLSLGDKILSQHTDVYAADCKYPAN